MVRKGRVGGFHDSELKEQLAAQVFSFSQEASNAMHHPLHGFTPETGNEPAVTPIPAATSFATTHRAQPPEASATPGAAPALAPGAAPALAPGAPAPTPEAMPPPPAPSAQQKARAQKALPAVETPSAARLLRQRSAEEAAPAPAQAATAAVPGGLQWEDMGSSSDEDDEPHVPVRVPVHDPQATKYSLDSMLEDVSIKVTICPAARVSLDAAVPGPVRLVTRLGPTGVRSEGHPDVYCVTAGRLASRGIARPALCWPALPAWVQQTGRGLSGSAPPSCSKTPCSPGMFLCHTIALSRRERSA